MFKILKFKYTTIRYGVTTDGECEYSGVCLVCEEFYTSKHKFHIPWQLLGLPQNTQTTVVQQTIQLYSSPPNLDMCSKECRIEQEFKEDLDV